MHRRPTSAVTIDLKLAITLLPFIPLGNIKAAISATTGLDAEDLTIHKVMAQKYACVP